MLGEKELIKLFPEFKELVEPSGIHGLMSLQAERTRITS